MDVGELIMYKITIDPGHGGRDHANRGPTGYIEAEGTLKIALLLERSLQKLVLSIYS